MIRYYIIIQIYWSPAISTIPMKANIFISILMLNSFCAGRDIPQRQPPPEHLKNSGFTLITTLGLVVNTTAGLSASIIGGSHINEHQSIGLGIGTDSYDSVSAMPLFVDLRGYLLSGDIKPMFFIQPGYALAWREGANGNIGGVTLKTGAGMKYFIGTDFAFFFDAAFKYQMASRVSHSLVYNGYYYYQVDSESSTSYKSFILELGFSF
jgi:hypothetical protein